MSETPRAAANPITDMVRTPIRSKPRADELLAAAERARCEGPEDAERIGILVKQIRAVYKHLEDERKAVKKPVMDGMKQLDRRFKALTDPLQAAIGRLNGLHTDWLMEQQRRAQEEAERLRREREEQDLVEAAEAEAAGDIERAEEILGDAEHAPQPVVRQTQQVHSGFTTTSLRTTWDVEVLDETQVPRELMAVDMRKVRAERDRLLDDAMKQRIRDGHQPIPGVRIIERKQATTR